MDLADLVAISDDSSSDSGDDENAPLWNVDDLDEEVLVLNDDDDGAGNNGGGGVLHGPVIIVPGPDFADFDEDLHFNGDELLQLDWSAPMLYLDDVDFEGMDDDELFMNDGEAEYMHIRLRGRNKPPRPRKIRPLVQLCAEQLLQEPNLDVLDSYLEHVLPRSLFYDLLCSALSTKKPRCFVIQLILKHWPEESLKVSRLGLRPGTSFGLRNHLEHFGLNPELSLMYAFFSAFGNTHRKYLRTLDLRGTGTLRFGTYIQELNEFQHYFMDPYFKNSDYHIRLPIRYGGNRCVSIAPTMNWPKILADTGKLFQVSNLTMDFRRHSNMSLLANMRPEFLESLYIGEYSLHCLPSANAKSGKTPPSPSSTDEEEGEGPSLKTLFGKGSYSHSLFQQSSFSIALTNSLAKKALKDLKAQMLSAGIPTGGLSGSGGSSGGPSGGPVGGGAGPSGSGPSMPSGNPDSDPTPGTSKAAAASAGLPAISKMAWITRVGAFDQLTAITLSTVNMAGTLERFHNPFVYVPDEEAVQLWSEAFTNLPRLQHLCLRFQVLKGALSRLLADSMPFVLRSLNLEGCVLDESDVIFLGHCKHAAKLERLNVGIWNFKQLIDAFLQIVPKIKNVHCLVLHMSGRVTDRASRRISAGHLLALVRALRSSLPNLRSLHLCDLDLYAKSTLAPSKVLDMGVRLVDELSPSVQKHLAKLVLPVRVTRTTANGRAVPFVGNMERMGTGGAKYAPMLDAFKRCLAEDRRRFFCARATHDAIRITTTAATSRHNRLSTPDWA